MIIRFKKTACALMLGCSLSMLAVPALAAKPSEKSLIELMQVTKANEQLKQLSDPNNTMMAQMVASSLEGIPESEISEKQRRELSKIITKYNQKIFNQDYVATLSQQVTQQYIKAAQQHFTQQEVDAQIAFYSSEVGKSIINKQPAMMQDFMLTAMPIINKTTMEQVQKVMPQMEAEIAALNIK